MTSLVLVLFSWAVSWAQTFPAVGTYPYNSGTTITLPARTQVTVTLQIWGGGGGGVTNNSNSARDGGGGGGYLTKSGVVYANTTNSPVTIAITVGDGGAAGANGGTSTISCSSCTTGGGGSGTYSAPGGRSSNNGGNTPNGGGAGGGGNTFVCGGGSCTTTVGGSGGSRQGQNTAGGGGGGAFPTAANGGTGSGGVGGDGGTTGGGKGGSTNNTTAPVAGTANTGGGGGGKGSTAANSNASAAGGSGKIIIEVTAMLPVELTSFTAMLNEKAVEINWATANELNNEKFVVETSQIGEVFLPLGEVRGAGTTFEPQTYKFTHRTPSEGTNYYRLKQVDFDGTFAYSKVVAVNAPGSNDIFAFPNPTKDKITLQYDHSKGSANIHLLDALGRRLNASIGGYTGNYEVQFPLGLPKGTYWLKVERGGKVQTLPVVKE